MTAVYRRAASAFVVTALAACADGGGTTDAVVDAQSPPDLARTVERLMPALERISGLDRVETLRVRRQSREDARAYVIARLEHELPQPERELLRRTYVALGLLPDTLDLDALMLDLYTEQVLGYYAPTEQTLFLVEGGEADELQVIAHELVHALQDQHTNLDSLVSSRRGNDRQAAAHAALEGHAMLVMLALAAEQATRREIDPAALPPEMLDQDAAMDAQEAEFPVFRRAPRIVRETLLFPYIDGAAFVHAVWQARSPMPRYPAPIDSLLPQSTEQVMRPVERFIADRDDPDVVALPSFPAGWTVQREDDLGMLETSVFLTEHLSDSAADAANGWDGDRYALLAAPDGSDVLYWLSVWETPADADRFADAVRSTAELRSRELNVVRLELDGRPAVRIIDGPPGVDTSVLNSL